MAAADHVDGRISRTEQAHAIRHRSSRKEPFSVGHCRFVVIGGNDQRRQPAKGRQAAGFACGQLMCVERFAIARNHRPHHGMIWMKCLQERLARP